MRNFSFFLGFCICLISPTSFAGDTEEKAAASISDSCKQFGKTKDEIFINTVDYAAQFLAIYEVESYNRTLKFLKRRHETLLCFEFSLIQKADPNQPVNSWGATGMLSAAFHNSVMAAQILKNYGANVDLGHVSTTDGTLFEGWTVSKDITPLELAEEKNRQSHEDYSDIIQFLKNNR